jgi:uncharacterized protein (TIGR02466 family)
MINTVFGMPVLETHLPEFDKIQSELIERVSKSFSTPDNLDHELSEGGSTSSYYKYNFRLEDHIDIKILVDFATDQSKIYWKELGYRDDFKPKVFFTWANLTPPGGSWAMHNHNPCPLSACFYLNASPEMGNLIFENPLSTLLGTQPYPIDYVTRKFEHTVLAESGKLVIFPGYLNHRVEKNTSNTTRLIVGFNIGY